MQWKFLFLVTALNDALLAAVRPGIASGAAPEVDAADALAPANVTASIPVAVPELSSVAATNAVTSPVMVNLHALTILG